MFKQIFEELDKELEEVQQMLKEEMDSDQILKKWKDLKQISDDLVEGWLTMEEKMSELSAKLEDITKKKSSTISVSMTKVKERDLAFRKGQGFFHLTMYGEASEQFQASLSLNPDNDLARLYFAISNYSVGNVDFAIQAFQMILASSDDPKILALTHHMIGNYHVSCGNLERSLGHFYKATENAPSFTDSLFNAGYVHYRLGEYEKAIDYLKKTIYLSPDDWEAMLVMSTCFSHMGLSRRSFELKKQAVEISNHPRAGLEFARTCEGSGLYDKASEWYERLEKNESFAYHAYSGLACCMLFMNDRSRAIGWLKKGLSIYPSNLELNLLLALMLKHEGQTKKAYRLFVNMNQSEMDTKLTLESFNRIEKLMMMFPDRIFSNISPSSYLLYQLGAMYFLKGDFHKSLSCYGEAEKLAEYPGDLSIFKGICYYAMKQHEEAKKHFVQWLGSA